MITRCLHCGNVTAADLVFDLKVGVRINEKGRKVGQASLASPPPNPMTLPFDLPLCMVRGLAHLRNVKILRKSQQLNTRSNEAVFCLFVFCDYRYL